MQKSWILFVLLGIIGSNAQVINIPDSNFKAVLLAADVTNSIAQVGTIFPNNSASMVSVKIDTNNNGEIEVNEAQVINYLLLQYSNISDLTGIEYFINLKYLFINNNTISTVDNLYGLTQMERLFCNTNQISSLNIDNFTGLRILGCSNNQISTLNFSNNPILIQVYCGNNQLTSLDFSHNPLFTDLGCKNNPNLTDINIKNGVAQQFPPNTIYNECWTGCPSLSRICADSFELSALQTYLSDCGIATAGITFSTTCALGEEAIVRDPINVFPNPNNGTSTINTQQENDITIYDILGQLVFEKKKALQTLVTNLKQGLYFVKIDQYNHTTKIVKIVVE